MKKEAEVLSIHPGGDDSPVRHKLIEYGSDPKVKKFVCVLILEDGDMELKWGGGVTHGDFSHSSMMVMREAMGVSRDED